MLEVRGLSKRFGGVHVFSEIDLCVGDEEIVGLIGPNGAGKSTVINCITGTLAPDSGEVLFAGRRITRARPDQVSRQGLARTFQDARLLGNRTAYENVLLGTLSVGADARPWRRSRSFAERQSDVANRAETALDHVGCGHLADLPADHLGAGQQRLVSVARAVASGARCILLDEPAAGLNDTETAVLTENLRAVREAGVALLVVEHHMGLVMGLCDRVVVLAGGEIIADGTPERVRSDPAVISMYLGSAA